uniref:Uncharacterized protein n=1 Tax=Setaria italica TaxID=4555 RepID=K4A1D1_SETIT
GYYTGLLMEQIRTSQEEIQDEGNGQIPNPKDDASEAILMSENVEEDSHDNEEDEDGSQELAEEQVEAFIRSEQLAASEGNNVDIDSKYTPQIGMEFKDRDDAHHFFSFYGFLARFEVVVAHVTRTTSKKRNNEVYKQEMKCHRYGKPLKNKEDDVIEDTLVVEVENTDKEKRKTNVQVKTNCKCVMVVKEIVGIWRVIRLDLDHNHKLSPQNRNQLFSGRKYMTYMKKGMIRTLNDNNIPTRKMIAILSYLRGGLTTLPHKTKDKRKVEDPTFYYIFQVDKDMEVKNLFWREGISLQWYAEYGECVSFDTMYMTNRYNLPFTSFVGITGHSNTCLFACAFLSDETTATFEWVFETFLDSMGGKHPKSIITNQGKAMKTTIETVFPSIRHRNCFFHIKLKCYNKNISVLKNTGLVKVFEDTMNFSVTEDEFEMIFKDNVGPTYSLASFLREYQRIVDVIRNKEEIDDNQSKKTTKRNRELQRIRKYIVLTDLTEGREQFSWICGKFNKDGIFCTHILKVIVEEELLRFNLLSRQGALLISKGAKKKEIATQYLSEEFKRIEKHLDMLLAEADRGASSSVTIESGKAISLEESSRNLLEEIVVLRDPDRI